MGLITKFKFNKTIKYLDKNIFSINRSDIIDGNAIMLPEFKWIFVQSTTNTNLSFIDLAIKDKEYTSIDDVALVRYISITSPNKYITTLADEFCWDTAPSLSKEQNEFIFDFYKNVLPDDTYGLIALKNIIKAVSDEINNTIYCNEENEDNINYVEKDIESAVPLSYTEVKQLIKTGHRNYMDGIKRGD